MFVIVNTSCAGVKSWPRRLTDMQTQLGISYSFSVKFESIGLTNVKSEGQIHGISNADICIIEDVGRRVSKVGVCYS